MLLREFMAFCVESVFFAKAREKLLVVDTIVQLINDLVDKMIL